MHREFRRINRINKFTYKLFNKSMGSIIINYRNDAIKPHILLIGGCKMFVMLKKTASTLDLVTIDLY